MPTQSYSIARTKHGEVRMQQRGFKNEDIDVIAQYGTETRDKVFLLRSKDVDEEIRRLKKQIKRLDRNRNRSIVMANDTLITCYR